MPQCQLDHLVVAAATLDDGIAHVEKALGVTVPFGGKHPHMGTHNALMQLGPTCFLEIIAIDPEAPAPSRPRWFGLDDPAIQAALEKSPRLHTWVCRTDDVAGAGAASPIPTGPIEEGRRGELVWQITIPRDGAMPEGGLLPTLIQWPEHLGPGGPAPRMADLGCGLERLTISHPDPARLETALAAIGAAGLADIQLAGEGGKACLTAQITSPQGMAVLA